MTIRSFLLRTTLTAFAGSTFAFGAAKAADLDPALEDPAQIYGSLPSANVVFGSGWYVRGDAALTNAFKVGAPRPPVGSFANGIVSTGSPSYNFSLGGGYAFTNHFRADLLADFFQPTSLIGQLNRYDALANGYFDLGTWSIATPYIGAGVGVAFGNVKGPIYGGPKYYDPVFASYHNLAFAGMAGVAFDVYPHVKIDAGYRYVNDGKVGGTEIYSHELRAGLRYMIDN